MAGTNPVDFVSPAPAEGRLLLQLSLHRDGHLGQRSGSRDNRLAENGRVVLVNTADLHRLGLREAQRVDLVSEWPITHGVMHRYARDFRVIVSSTVPARTAAAGYDAHSLLPCEVIAERLTTALRTWVPVRLQPVDPA